MFESFIQVPMRKDSGNQDSHESTRNQSFIDPLMRIVQRIEENVKKNCQGMEQMGSKINSLAEKIDKLESHVTEINSYIRGSQMRPTHEETSIPIFKGAEADVEKEVNANVKKMTNISSSSLDESFKLKQKIAEAYKDAITRPKHFSTILKDEV